MATIRPADLPEATTVPSDAAIIIDTGSTVQKATPQKIVDVARPIASQTEAEGGADNAKAMTPLRVKQYIDTLGIPGQIEGIDGRLDATEGDISTAQSDITSLDTRVTTAETDITARPTSTQLAAPEGAAGIGTADGGSVEEALSVLGSAANPLAGFHADGVTDDTANFAALETNITGQQIDLKGKTYLVASAPTGNGYINGFFKTGSDLRSINYHKIGRAHV